MGNSPEILVASGIKKAIKVKVHIIGQFIVQTRFVCQFNIEGRVTSVNAQLLGDTIYCDSMEFSYTSRAPNITATFAVIWGGSKPLDNPDNIHSKSLNIVRAKLGALEPRKCISKIKVNCCTTSATKYNVFGDFPLPLGRVGVSFRWFHSQCELWLKCVFRPRGGLVTMGQS